MTLLNPLISCLCITDNRVHYLKRAYNCYQSQTYNNLELVVVCMSDDNDTLEYLKGISHNDSSITTIKIERKNRRSLGYLRNTAINAAKGLYVCVWDDDDIYHIERVERCLSALTTSKKSAVALSNLIIYDVVTGDIYSSTRRVWEQTLLCEKAFLQDNNIYYAELDCNEDTPFAEKLWRHVFLLSDPSLYIYSFHGLNTSSVSHFQSMIKDSSKLLDSHREIVAKIANQEISITEGAKAMYDSQFLKHYPFIPKKLPLQNGFTSQLAD